MLCGVIHSFLRLSLWAFVCLLSLPFTHARVADQLAQRLGGLLRRYVCYEDGVYSLSAREMTGFRSVRNGIEVLMRQLQHTTH
jgi:hypothetical protein